MLLMAVDVAAPVVIKLDYLYMFPMKLGGNA
jgi:hypothetical protein